MKALIQIDLSDIRVGDTIDIANPNVPVCFRVIGREGKDLIIQSFTFRVGLPDVITALGFRDI